MNHSVALMALHSPSAVVQGRCLTITNFSYNELVGALIARSLLCAAFSGASVFSSSLPADAVSSEGAEDAAALVAHQNVETKSVPLP